jgi:hypothetical protein
MRAKRIDVDQVNFVSADVIAATAATVAQGGVVADWHRTIEERLAGLPELPGETLGEAIVRNISRAVGWAALAAGFGAVAYLIAG